jgi:hypothetical protein
LNISTDTKKFISQGIQSATKFSVANNAHVMKLLSDSLYRDKIAAPIRELSANAIDSHIAAGCPAKPFDVHLPNPNDDTFRIRDYGTGMSRQNMETLYTTYGVSDKTDNNDLVGCLGIGSKSPFAYTDSFTVTSYYNGIRYIYLAGKCADGIPTLNFVSANPTDEPNGMEISFAVKSYDFSNFSSKAQNIFTYFSVKPNVFGGLYPLKLEQPDSILSGPGWKLFNHSSPVLVMGGMVYPIESTYFSDKTTPNAWYYKKNKYVELLTAGLEVNVPIGSVDIDISREGLQYNPKTITYLKNISNTILQSIADVVGKKFSSCKNIWDVRCACMELFVGGGTYAFLSSIKDLITYPFGLTSPTSESLVQLGSSDYLYSTVRTYQNGSQTYNYKNNFNLPAYRNTRFFYNDMKVGAYMRAKYWSKDCKIYLFNPGGSTQVDKDKCIKKFADEAGIELSDIKPISSLAKPPFIPAAPGLRKKCKSFIKLDTTSWRFERNWRLQDIDTSIGGLYIIMPNKTILHDGKNLSIGNFNRIITQAINLKLLKANDDIYAFRPSVVKKEIADNEDWVELTEYLHKEGMNNVLAGTTAKLSIGYTIDNFLSSMNVSNFDINKPFGEFISEFLSYQKKNMESEGIILMLSYLGYTVNPKSHYIALDKFKDMIKIYPMLNYISESGFLTTKKYQAFIDYINYIDKNS